MSLTTTARNFKRGMKGVFFLLFFYYILTLLVIPQVQRVIEEIQAMREPPNPIYGKLDALKFTRKTNVNPNIKYVLNTKDGRLPTGIPRKLPVYKFKSVQYSYLAGVRAQEQATSLGYTPAELISDLKGKEFKWRSLVSGGTLTINNETGGIIIFTDLYGKGTNYKKGNLDYSNAKEYAVAKLKDLGVYDPIQFSTGTQKIILGTFVNSRLTDTKTPAEAQVARVDFYRNVGKYPILGPDPSKSLMSITLRPADYDTSPFNVPFMDVQFWDYNKDATATYPIIPVTEAWKQLVSNNAIPVSTIAKGTNLFAPTDKIDMEKILINKIYIAYYETREFQKYMQPIYVFEGKYNTLGTDGGDITFYFPAVASEMVKKIEPVKPATTNQGTTQPANTAPSK